MAFTTTQEEALKLKLEIEKLEKQVDDTRTSMSAKLATETTKYNQASDGIRATDEATIASLVSQIASKTTELEGKL